MSSNIFSSSSEARNFSTRVFVLQKKKGFHLFVLKVVMTCFIWDLENFRKT